MYKPAHIASRLLPIDSRSKGKSNRRLFLESLEERTLLATLAGTVWYDLDASGTREPGENGQSGWTVFLDANNNGMLEGGTANFSSTNVPLVLPDLTTVTSQTVVSGLTNNISDLNVTVSLTHTFDSDLTITLISPSGTRVVLADSVGGSGDNFTNTTFDDQAFAPINSGSAPFSGAFRPTGSLSVLNGTAGNGTWQLEVADTVGIDSGTLTGWSLGFSTGEVYATTDSMGDYFFLNLAAGNYVVREVLQSSWTRTFPGSGSHAVTVGAGQLLTGLDFGNFQVNTPPVFVSNVPDQIILEDGSALVNFSVYDFQTQPNSLVLSATTSDPTLLPLSGIVFSGSGTSRNISITPASNEFGTATVTLTLTDAGGLTAQDTVLVTVNSVNDQPTLAKGANLTLVNDAGPQSIANWATAISVGPANESSQTLSFRVTTISHGELFSTAPAISGNGTLTFTPVVGAVGTSTVSIVAVDNGGIANGGLDTSVAQTFTITFTAPPPTFQVMAFTPTNTGAVFNLSRDVLTSALNLYDVVPSVFGAADVTLVGAMVGNVRGSLVVDPNLRRLTFVKTSGVLAPDVYTLTLRSAVGGVQDSAGELLDGDANGTPGGDYVQSFVVNPPAANAVNLSIGNFARGPAQPVNLPANVTTGIPISFSNGAGITAASFQLRYNPALLTIPNVTGAVVAPGLTGASVTIDTATTPGIASIVFLSPTPLPAGTTRFIDLVASVPFTATYLSKHVLDFTNVSLNGGSLPAFDDDAVHVVAYFGDTTGSGNYSSSDATRVARLAAAVETGVQNFRLLDPVIIADLTSNGGFSSSDTTRIQQVVVGIPTPEVPLPLPGVSYTTGGPDPKLSIPTDLVAARGTELTIPVNIDSIVDLTGNGLESAELIIHYDATALDVTSVTLGSLVADRGWTIASRIDPLAGRVLVSLGGMSTLEGMFQGELVQLHAAVKADAPSGSFAINLAASAHDLAIRTQLNEGWLTLIPAPTDAANDPGVDGLVTILPAADARTPRQERAAYLANLLQSAGSVVPRGASELHTAPQSSVSQLSVSATSELALLQLLAELNGGVASGDSATSPLARIRRR